MDRKQIARVAHEINRAYCASLGDASQPAWEDAPEWQQGSALAGVDMHLAKPDATPEQSHESWLAQKLAEGWKYGPVKDAEKKEHPCCVPYAELPAEQKAKDYLFRSVVHALKVIEPEKVLVEAPVPLTPPPADAVASVIPNGHVAVQYVGRRPDWTDHLYGTGLSFVADQVRPLPGSIARQFLRHLDLFREAKIEVAPPEKAAQIAEVAEAPRDDTAEILEAAKQKQAEELDKENQLQDLRQSVTFMEKDALKEFVSRNYRQKLDGRLSVEAMRTQALQLIDQFGAV